MKRGRHLTIIWSNHLNETEKSQKISNMKPFTFKELSNYGKDQDIVLTEEALETRIRENLTEPQKVQCFDETIKKF